MWFRATLVWEPYCQKACVLTWCLSRARFCAAWRGCHDLGLVTGGGFSRTLG